jgi:hypothetical protein
MNFISKPKHSVPSSIGRSKNTQKVYCPISESDVTVLTGSSAKVVCPHISTNKPGALDVLSVRWSKEYCKLQEYEFTPLGYHKCDILEGMEEEE